MAMAQEAREAQRNYMREYRQRNRDRINAQRRNWNAQNREKVRGYQKRYWDRLAEKRYIRATYAEYGLENKAYRKKLLEMCRSMEYDNIVRKAAYQASAELAPYLIKSVTKGKSYDLLEFDQELGRIFVGKTDFYGYRRLFLHYLDVALRDLQMNEGEDMLWS